MSTPVGHLLAGAVIGASFSHGHSVRQRVAAGALAAIFADLDFIPGAFWGDPARFHHVGSHSLFFVTMAFLVGWVLAPQVRLKWGLLAGSAYGSHLLLDWMTQDLSPPVGIPLLWPVSEQVFQSPFAFLPMVQHTSRPVISFHNIALVGLEVALWGSLLLWALWIDHRRQSGKTWPGVSTLVRNLLKNSP